MTDIFKDILEKEQQLLEQLKLSPISDVTGIVNINGVSAVIFGDEEQWTLKMQFDKWRIKNGHLISEPLYLLRKVCDQELEDIQETIKAETIIKIKARIKETSYDRYDAIFEEFIEEIQDDVELNQCLEELKKPIIYSDTIFGLLTFDRQVKSYSGKYLLG